MNYQVFQGECSGHLNNSLLEVEANLGSGAAGTGGLLEAFKHECPHCRARKHHQASPPSFWDSFAKSAC